MPERGAAREDYEKYLIELSFGNVEEKQIKIDKKCSSEVNEMPKIRKNIEKLREIKEICNK
ncbi:MAG: hypothetical protein K2H18_04160 [Muribaculaceae bacterium]|nr:hypothetical protein [Muribaculaceae bacterium]